MAWISQLHRSFGARLNRVPSGRTNACTTVSLDALVSSTGSPNQSEAAGGTRASGVRTVGSSRSGLGRLTGLSLLGCSGYSALRGGPDMCTSGRDFQGRLLLMWSRVPALRREAGDLDRAAKTGHAASAAPRGRRRCSFGGRSEDCPALAQRTRALSQKPSRIGKSRRGQRGRSVGRRRVSALGTLTPGRACRGLPAPLGHLS